MLDKKIRTKLFILSSLALGFAANIGAGYAASGVVKLGIGGPYHTLFGPYLIVALVMLIVVTSGMILALRIQKRSLSDLGFKIDGLSHEAGLGCVVGVCMTVVAFGLILPLTGGSGRSDVVEVLRMTNGSAWNMAGLIIAGWIVGGYTEELFYRGFLITTLRRLFGDAKFAIAAAILISSVYFGSKHAYQGFAGVAETTFNGLVWASLYVWRGRLAAPIIAHGIFDMLNILAIVWFCR